MILMFTKNKILLCLTAMLTLMSYYVRGDDNTATNAVSLTVNGSALLAIKTPAINLFLSGATEAGAPIQTSSQDSTTRLRISSLVEGSKTRTISAGLDVQPQGTNLLITVQKPNADFYGSDKEGTLLSDVILTTTAKTIVTDIGTCWSGTASDDGYVIKYIFQLIEGATSKSTNVIVTYTLSEAS